MKFVAVLMAGFLAASAAFAAANEPFADPVLEARARNLQRELRCLVCQGQSIDESNAELAADLRTLVREHLAAGESDAQIKSYLVARYGAFILMNPPVRSDTYALWFGPALLVFLGGGVIFLVVSKARRRVQQEPEPSDLDVAS